jgi:microcystin-dependent protein
MGTPYLGEIRITAFSFAPRGWALCNGQTLAINANQALFSLLGTTYGGNGVTNFQLPNLQGRVPLHFGGGIAQGQAGGADAVTLTTAQLPAHQHAIVASTDFANSNLPGSGVTAAKVRGGVDVYAASGAPLTPLNPAAVAASGGGQPHENEQPSLVLSFIIALQGIFPTHN